MSAIKRLSVNVPFLDLKAQYLSIKTEIDQAIQRVLDSCAFSGGPFVEVFERRFAAVHSTDFAVGTSSGTAALHLALMALEIGSGHEVILPANTFIATAEAVSFTGAKPIFVDCDPRFHTLDPSALAGALTSKTRAVIGVHLYGQPADLDSIKEFADKHGLFLVEDCAQAHLAAYRGKPVGSRGIMGCFSFYPGKNLGAYGEGGAVVTNDRALAEKVSALRNHGSAQRYIHDYIGHNYRMEGFQAAILDVKLNYIEQWTQQRRQVADWYREYLSAVPEVRVPDVRPESRHVYHLFVVRAPDRGPLIDHLKRQGIETGIHYPIPCHLQKAYAYLELGEGSFPVSEQSSREILSLPIYPELSEEKVQYVAQQIKAFYRK
jgi:dTDP-4-amino-4,6-dideoxygalactose transaminase